MYEGIGHGIRDLDKTIIIIYFVFQQPMLAKAIFFEEARLV